LLLTVRDLSILSFVKANQKVSFNAAQLNKLSSELKCLSVDVRSAVHRLNRFGYLSEKCGFYTMPPISQIACVDIESSCYKTFTPCSELSAQPQRAFCLPRVRVKAGLAISFEDEEITALCEQFEKHALERVAIHSV